MTTVLVCWEDRYHEGLQHLLRQAVAAAAAAMSKSPPTLHASSSLGNKRFGQFIQTNWVAARQRGWSTLGGGVPVDHLVCIADADRATDCCRAVGPPPPASNPTAGWVANAGSLWTADLRGLAPVDSNRVHGHLLRWNLESTLISLFDQPHVLSRLGRFDAVALQVFLSTCIPAPGTPGASSMFVDDYRDSQTCLTGMVTSAHAHARVLRRSNPDRSIALEMAAKDSQTLARVLGRVPDLQTVAGVVASLP